MDLATACIVGGSVGLAASFGVLVAVRRALRSRADARALADSVARERDLARSLHPVIDPDICIGSLACLKSCPERDILGIVNGAARSSTGTTASATDGARQSARSAPSSSSSAALGAGWTSRRWTSSSSPPGRESTSSASSEGWGLIRNAMIQGIECVEHLAESFPSSRAGVGAGNGPVDIAIVGSGPAGLAAALTARKAGLSCRILDQGTMGGTVAHFPRHKIAMTEPVELPLVGRFGKRRMSKDELLAAFQRIVEVGNLDVQERTKVVGIQGEDGAFSVETDRGALLARKVLLAIRASWDAPPTGGPGEEREKVTYSLADTEQYRDSDVLVVGGGDAALESAIQLVQPGEARVTLSHRGDVADPLPEANRARIDELSRAGRLRLLLSSTVQKIGVRCGHAHRGGTHQRIRNDYVLVHIGGELPARDPPRWRGSRSVATTARRRLLAPRQRRARADAALGAGARSGPAA